MKRSTAVLAFARTFGLLIIGCDSGPVNQSEPTPESKAPVSAAQGQASLQQDLAALRRATSKYQDVKEAEADEDVQHSPFVPGMGFHYVKGTT